MKEINIHMLEACLQHSKIPTKISLIMETVIVNLYLLDPFNKNVSLSVGQRILLK